MTPYHNPHNNPPPPDSDGRLGKAALYSSVGLVITYLGLLITLGWQNAFMVIVFSVICTLGVSLVFWLPLFWLIGYLTFAVVALFRNTSDETSSFAIAQTRSLQSYIQRSLQAGTDEVQIRRRLQEQGWSDRDIAQAWVDVMS